MRPITLAVLLALPQSAHADDDPTLAIPASSPQGMQIYRAEHLRIQPVTSWSYHHQSIGFSNYSGYGMSTFFALGPSFVTPHHEWLIAKGPSLIDVPSFLEITGQHERREDLLKRINKNRGYVWGFGSVAAAGAVSFLGGLIGSLNVQSDRDALRVEQMYNYGALAFGTGLVLASIPAGRMKSLVGEPGTSMSPEEAGGFIRDHNDALRHSLGLSAEEAFEIEQSEPHRRW